MSVVGPQVRAILRRMSDRKRFKDGRGIDIPGLQNAIDIYGQRYLVGWSAELQCSCWVGSAGFNADTSHTRLGDEGGGGFDKISDVLDVPELLR